MFGGPGDDLHRVLLLARAEDLPFAAAGPGAPDIDDDLDVTAADQGAVDAEDVEIPPESVPVRRVSPPRAVPVASIDDDATRNARPSTGAWVVVSMKSTAARL